MQRTEQKVILLVEDETIIALAEAKLIKSFGYEVLTAETGEKAVDLASGSPEIDLILMDINLGRGIDGPEAARLILEKRRIPLVFLTSHAEEDYVDRVREITRYGYVIKNSGSFVLKSSIEMAFHLFDAHEKANAREEELKKSERSLAGDIAKRKAVEAELTRSQNLLNETGRIGKIGGWRVIVETQETQWTEGLYRIYEVASSFLPTVERVMAFYTPASREILTQAIRHTMESGEPFDLEAELITAKNNRRWIRIIGRAEYTNGRITSRVGITQDVTDRKAADERIKALLTEKELLLKEVHHRIKNNMRTMMSLLALQANEAKDPVVVTALENAQNRFHSMEVLYEKLFTSENLKEMSVKDYLPPLAREVVKMFPNGGIVKLETQADDFVLGVRELASLGIIVNELLANAMKHAFAGRTEGSITLRAVKNDKLVTVSVADDGIGLPEAVGIGGSTGFGLRLAGALAKQLAGSLRIERDKGTRFVLEFEP